MPRPVAEGALPRPQNLIQESVVLATAHSIVAWLQSLHSLIMLDMTIMVFLLHCQDFEIWYKNQWCFQLHALLLLGLQSLHSFLMLDMTIMISVLHDKMAYFFADEKQHIAELHLLFPQTHSWTLKGELSMWLNFTFCSHTHTYGPLKVNTAYGWTSPFVLTNTLIDP